MEIIKLILGRRVKADHPITVLNPDETFIVTQVKEDEETHKIYVRGEHTM